MQCITLMPKHRITRLVALAWLFACLTFLILTLLQSDLYADERSALAQLVPVYFLNFPSGHLAPVAVSKIKLALYLHDGYTPSVLSESIFLWLFSMVAGYVQWFMLLPWISRSCLRVSRLLFDRQNN